MQPPGEPTEAARPRRLPWARLAAVAALGAALLGGLVAANFWRRGEPLTNLLSPGREGPALAVVREDFPDAPLLVGKGDDGQQFYAIARDPFDLRGTARHLDRPRYRLQRIGYPLLAWALHPTGGGRGLLWALLAANLLAVAGGCLAIGALAATWGRLPAWGLVFAFLPGSFISVRLATADVLATALALGTMAFVARGWLGAAAAAGVAAVLTKESVYLVVLGVGISAWRLRRDDVRLLLAAPVAAAALWWVVLRSTFPSAAAGAQLEQFGRPFGGVADAVSAWIRAEDWETALFLTVTVAMAVVALAVHRRGLATVALLLQLALLVAFAEPALVFLEGAPRILLPLSALTAVAIIAPRSREVA